MIQREKEREQFSYLCVEMMMADGLDRHAQKSLQQHTSWADPIFRMFILLIYNTRLITYYI